MSSPKKYQPNINAESIYVHIPFCKTKCPYCDFASWANKENLVKDYFDSLICEINTKCSAYLELNRNKNHISQVKTIFVGGGTPSMVDPVYYESLFEIIRKYFQIDENAEITFEVNPGTAKIDFLKGYKELGVNRVSIGAQSFDEKILEILGRKHSIDETIDTISKTLEAKIENFNLDLIYAVPGMTLKMWEESIKKALSFNPKHISSYSLSIETGTPFEKTYSDKKLLPGDDDSFEMYLMLCNLLKENSFIHYEVSNFAKKGFECRHNLNYWFPKEYFAFGNSSHRYLNGLRSNNLRGLEDYIKNPYIEQIYDFPVNSSFEKIMLSSRLSNGFNIDSIEKITEKNKKELHNLLIDMSNEGLLELKDNKIHLTDRGMFINNEILLKLL